MDGHSNTNNDGAPPPPPQARGRPPPSPAGSPKESLRKQNSRNSSSLHSSMRSSGPPQRPKLIRRDSSSQSQASHGSFRGRPRLNSNHSNYSSGLDQGPERGLGQRGRSFYNRPQPQVWFEEQPGDLQRDNSDANLLSASMDNEAVEDEAEATLLEVLGRRHQVSFANEDAPSRHRHHRNQYSGAVPNIDLSNLGSTSTQRPASAPSFKAVAQSLIRPSAPSFKDVARSLIKPSLHSRSKSQGGSLSRSLLKKSSSDERAVSSDWAFDPEGQLLQSFSEMSDQHEGVQMTGSLEDMINPTSSQDSAERVSPSRPSLPSSKSFANRNHQRGRSKLPLGFERGISDSTHDSAERVPPPRPNLSSSKSFANRRHQRGKSTLPLGFERGISDSSQSGLTTPGERARHVAFTMKMNAANNTDDPNRSVVGGDLPDLMHVMEANRDNDDRSLESGHKSGGLGSTRRGSNSNVSGIHSVESQSKGGASGFSSSGNFSGSGNKGNHRKQRPFSGISSSPFSNDGGFKTSMEHWFQAAELIQDLHQIPEEEEEETAVFDDLADENANFLSQIAASHPDVPDYPDEMGEGSKNEAGVVDEQTPMLQKNGRPITTFSPRKRKIHMWSMTQPAPNSRFYKILLWWTDLRKQMKILAVAFDAPFVKERIWAFFHNEFILFVMPALAISAFLYYQLNNPILSILPTDASISWWILFLIRHYLTLQLAYMSEYFFVDVLAMRSLLSVQLIGPLATLYTINAKGWPFTLTAWGVLNFLLNQEGHDDGSLVYSHWLYWTDIQMFTTENPSGAVAQADFYKELLVSMIIAGVATSIKRTLTALYLGKRLYIHYKPKLEKVMESMILLNEVADLGDAIGDYEFEKVDTPIAAERSAATRHTILLRDTIRSSTMIDVVKKQNSGDSESDSDEENADEASKESTPWNLLCAGSPGSQSDENEPLKNTVDGGSGGGSGGASLDCSSEEEVTEDVKVTNQETTNQVSSKVFDDESVPQPATTEEYFFAQEEELPTPTMDNAEPPITTLHEPVQGLLRNTSTTSHIKSLLDDWSEPVNKQDKMADPSIQEILMFRKALLFLDDTHPFGYSFGPAFTRESCIKSSKSLYKRLLSLSPGSPVVHFDVIGVLAYNTDGTFDDKKAKSLVRLFRPDKFDEVSLLPFVQSCDFVYKKLRYLRASHGNSTLIDSVLENIFNGVFGFFLGLTIMSVLQLNPWTLLVSMSTVLVSFAFALGPSAAKLIEGMIMIAVRRPFDLGDRISIVDCTGAPDNSGDPGYHDTWIVEDCNLFTTTLRLSRTNEVSTVNNGSIANTRIVNHGRSINACINVHLPMRIDATHDQVQIVQSALEQYIRDNPRVWACLVNFRITKVDPASEFIEYSARIQHVKSWQDLLPILQARGDLEKFCMEILMKLDIYYGGGCVSNHVYIKELPEQPIFSQEAAPFPDEPSMTSEIHHHHHD